MKQPRPKFREGEKVHIRQWNGRRYVNNGEVGTVNKIEFLYDLGDDSPLNETELAKLRRVKRQRRAKPR